MARVETDPNYSSPTFSRATAGTDLFKATDVQALAAAVSTHDHSTGKGVALTAGAIPNGTITSAMIADGTIVAGDIADGAVTSAKILDGTIQAADHAAASITNAILAADTARANLLCNGGFEIWQRGAGGFAANGAYSADRWSNSISGTDTLSVARIASTTNPSGAYAAECTFALGSGGGNTALIQQLRPGDSLEAVRGQTVTLSIRAYSAAANTLRAVVAVVGGATGLSSLHPGGGWQTLTATVAVAAAATNVQISVNFLVSGTYYLDNAMLVVGSVAADYAPQHPADDLARCLRYYEVIGDTSVSFIIGGYNSAGGSDYRWQSYKARKPAYPTITKSGTWVVANCSQPTVSSFTATDGFALSVTVTAAATWSAYANAPGQNVVVEANP